MSGADGALLGLILLAVVLALRAVRQGKTGGCSGDCARCRKDCPTQRK
ncbi:MAG: FeoB-associated Cys-rich membrane protein [Dysosmobacter sp.]|nr:FeoB-associated Cys-rich membrane protein [Dysosmobacter sp.]